MALGTMARLDGVANVMTNGTTNVTTNGVTTPAQAPHIQPLASFFDATSLLGDARAIRDRASKDGYLFFRGLMPREEIATLRREVVAQCSRRRWLEEGALPDDAIAHPHAAARASRDELLLLQADVQVHPAFAALRHDARIADILAAVFGVRAAAGYGDVCRLVFPRDLDRTTLPHQDYYYTRGSPSLWTVWLPLGDCPAALGGLAVVPGSHTDGLRAHDGGDGEAKHILLGADTPWVGDDFRAGDALLFNALTVHGARPNVTERSIRISADFRFRPSNDDGA